MAAITAGLVACTPQPPPRGPVLLERPGDPARLRSVLSDFGFAVTASETGLPATLTIEPNDPRTVCRTIYIRDQFGEGFSRGRFVDPDRVIIEAVATEPNVLSLSARGRYLNRYDNRRATAACDVSADFEAEVKSALTSP